MTSLRIKSEKAHRLAKEIAAMTGETLTTVVTEAIRERLVLLESEKAARRRDTFGRTQALNRI
jgi:antitoxin VapB